MKIILKAIKLNKSFGEIHALNDFGFELHAGMVLALIGPNGAGKTTLFNILSGFLKPDEGKVLLQDRDISCYPAHLRTQLGLYRTFQRVRIIEQISVFDNILLACECSNTRRTRIGSMVHEKTLSNSLKREKVNKILKKINLEKYSSLQARNLSYGEQKLLSLGMGMAIKATVYLLDEPFAGLAPHMVETAVKIIKEWARENSGIIIIDHNIDILMNLCHSFILMVNGNLVHQDSIEGIKNNDIVIDTYLGR